MVSRRLLVFLLTLVLTAASSTGGMAQPATPSADAAIEGHLAWVLSLFDGGAAELTVTDVESRFTSDFLDVVPPAELIATIQGLAELLGPLDPLEERSTGEGEFIGVFRSESGEGVQISIAVDPASGLIAGFFITPSALPSAAATPAVTPKATPVASPVAAGPVVDDPEAQIARYREIEASIRTVGEPVVEAVLVGDGAALDPYLSPDVAAALESQPVSEVIDSYTTRQVQMAIAEVGAYLFGQWTEDRIDGVTVQGGIPYRFTLEAEEPQTGDLPTGRWSGSIQQLRLDFAVVFSVNDSGDLAATIDIPAQGVEDLPLSDVRYLAERPVGDQVDRRVFAPGGRNNSYTADFAWGDHLLRVAVGVDVESGLVTAMQVFPAIPTPPPAADAPVSETTWRLPFVGTWWVFWGGDTELRNYHAATPSQRYACDLVIWKDGATWSGDGAENEDYWAWGQPVLAPADGTVVHAANDAADLPPNAPLDTRMQAGDPGGNQVVIQTGDDEYAILAHMQRGSVRVQEGDEVRAGDLLGLVGNSGNSSEPHIHIHVQDTPEIVDVQADGIPLRFALAVVDGELESDVVPTQGSFIANP